MLRGKSFGNNNLIDKSAKIKLKNKIFGSLDTNILFKPLVGHHIITFIPSGLAPGILNLIPDRFTVLIQMDRCDNHRMGHSRLVHLQTLGLCKAKRNVKCGLRVSLSHRGNKLKCGIRLPRT